MPEIKFREFTAKDSEQFKALNIEWLKKYFEVEPIDERVLSNPRSEILDSGGFIFMAEINDEVIGTFAFIKKGNQISQVPLKCGLLLDNLHFEKKIRVPRGH